VAELDITSIDITGSQSRFITHKLSFLKSGRNTMTCDDYQPRGKKIPAFEIGCACELYKSSDLRRWKIETAASQAFQGICQPFAEDEECFLFLPPRLLGYALKEKLCGQILVYRLRPVISVGENEQKTRLERVGIGRRIQETNDAIHAAPQGSELPGLGTSKRQH
jgi:hypothetical protein